MLNVYLTPNNFSNKKKPYSFRSRTTQSLTQNDLIDAVTEANTTVSKTDAVAVMTELEHQFNKAIERGASVSLFMGTFCAGASGTAESDTEMFSPKKHTDPRTPKRNHRISLAFRPARLYAEKLRSIAFKRIGVKELCAPVLYMLYNTENGSNTAFAPGGFITIGGAYIKFDPSDTGTGVFFADRKTDQTFRAQLYTRTTRVGSCAQIPPDTASGRYDVYIVSSDGKRSNTITIDIQGNSSQ
jgi:hypothetical protein